MKVYERQSVASMSRTLIQQLKFTVDGRIYLRFRYAPNDARFSAWFEPTIGKIRCVGDAIKAGYRAKIRG